MKKRIFLYYFIVFSFFLFPLFTSAETSKIHSCLNDDRYMCLCQYNVVLGHNNYNSSPSLGIIGKTIHSESIVDLGIVWDKSNQKYIIYSSNYAYSKGPSIYKDIFSNTGMNVFIDNLPSEESFRCPKYGYFDFYAINTHIGEDEFCFANDKDFCKSKKIWAQNLRT